MNILRLAGHAGRALRVVVLGAMIVIAAEVPPGALQSVAGPDGGGGPPFPVVATAPVARAPATDAPAPGRGRASFGGSYGWSRSAR